MENSSDVEPPPPGWDYKKHFNTQVSDYFTKRDGANSRILKKEVSEEINSLEWSDAKRAIYIGQVYDEIFESGTIPRDIQSLEFEVAGMIHDFRNMSRKGQETVSYLVKESVNELEEKYIHRGMLGKASCIREDLLYSTKQLKLVKGEEHGDQRKNYRSIERSA